MSRRLAVALGAVAAGAAATAPAYAEPLGAGWEGEFTDSSIVDGYEATGAELVVPVAFEYSGPPGSVITDVTLRLVAVGGECPDLDFPQALGSGDGDGTAGTAPTTPDSPPQEPTTGPADSITWRFAVDPRCNGVYDLSVTARADPPGVLGPDDTESQPLVVEDVEVSLSAPSPEGVVAEAGPDRKVTVRWQAPASWAGGPPRDAVGYRVQRASGAGEAVVVADDLKLDVTSIVDDALVGAPAGTHRYEVVAMRRNADGNPLLSAPGTTELALAARAPVAGAAAGPAVPRSSAGGGARVGTTGAGVGQPAVAPATEFDPGFETELDYADPELGDEEAIVPDDAGLFEVVSEDPVGQGVLVPGAVALCLAVWAGHLRHLARRAAPGPH